MIVPDVNVLVLAAQPKGRQADSVRAWWQAAVNGDTPVGLPWVVAAGFLRVVTNPRIFDNPPSTTTAMDVVDGWLGHPNVTVVGPGRRHALLLRQFVEAFGGNAVPDAHIAAIAAEHDATLWSTDRDFARLPGLRWRDPLAEPS